MADLGDIKDAGILASFERWGWPWHGLIESGEVGSTGQLHTQPGKCNSWLIDKGLDPLDLTPEQIAAYAADGMEWRNYALLPGSTVYGTALDDQTYIVVDDVGDNWMVTLTYTFLGSSQIRITASIVRFGLFIDIDETLPTPITKTVDVTCAAIELSNPVSAQGSITFTEQNADLQDVYTNGHKAIVGVLLTTSGGLLYLFSCIEFEITGEGGADGSGLSITASEAIGQPNLCAGSVVSDTNTYTNQGKAVSYTLDNSDCLDDGVGTGIKTYFITDPGPIDTLNIGTRTRVGYTISARYAYYDAAGNVKAVRFRYGFWETTDVQMTSGWQLFDAVQTYDCVTLIESGSGYAKATTTRTLNFETGWVLMENDTDLDQISWKTTHVEVTERTASFGGYSDNELSDVYSSTAQGSLAAYLPTPPFSINDSGTVAAAFHNAAISVFNVSASFTVGSNTVGLHRMNNHAIAFVVDVSGNKHYGDALTPRGLTTVSVTPASTVTFAWNRKTDDYAFSSGPAAYV